MAILKKKDVQALEQQKLSELIALAIRDADGLLTARQKIIDMLTEKAADYLATADSYRDSIKEEAQERLSRWAALKDQRKGLEMKLAEAESDLGNALMTGSDSDQAKAESAVSAVSDEIAKLDNRIKIFTSVKFTAGKADKIPELETKYNAILETAAMCNRLFDGMEAAVAEHLRAYDSTRGRLYPGYPANITSKYQPLVNIDFSTEGLDLDTLRKLSGGDVTIEDLATLA